MRLPVWFLVVVLLCLYVAADSTTCSATKRCEQGCCNKSGNCGFGPDYCGKAVCRSDCGRKSECNPGFGKQWAKSEKCPLNVCCSKHGYCGTTKDFCGSKTVKRPSCKKGGEMERVVGYFEGWARNRPCESFLPEQIPIGLYTHINFAFGTINPNTFSLEPNAAEDKGMYERLMLLKKKDKNLKIYLAIGGWTFNDPGSTASVFSDLAASPARQRLFFSSVQSFMSTYGFDGLDLDWEYPVDNDRGGKDYDYTNFPKFMAKLKDMMDTGDKGLTITLPASYWYLQYFDIKKLEPTVDFFNIMSYDLHGAWDQNVNWTKPYLNAHTNLTEVESALDLLWRNDISPSKVVMGLGFYGRAFTASSAECMEPGCLFIGAANAGSCSREKGILLNSEIDNVIEKRKLKPKLYKEEAVQVVKWEKQWVSYDDEETLQMKVDRAGERCLGGVMVWAISHDTKDAKYNNALAKILDRKVTKGSLDDDETAGDFVKKPYEQCRWTNCKESCPKGWVHVGRLDKHARKDELMHDETGCGGDGQHSFCCPPEEDIPECGWYGHGNGACEKTTNCPSGMSEIGSNQMYCDHPPMVQTACCKTDSNSMKVYGTCKWGEYPECDSSPDCPYEDYNWPVASSGSGSGGLQCSNQKDAAGLESIGVQMRNYCCTTKPDMRFIDCQVFRNIGPMIKGQEDGVCRSNCPSDRVRVAIDWAFQVCSAYEVGGQATCCKTTYSQEKWEPNDKIAAYKEAMASWVEDETCPSPSKVFNKRHLSSSSTELAVRADKAGDMTPLELLTDIIGLIGSQAILSQLRLIWNNAIRDRYEWLQTTYMSNYVRQVWRLDYEGPAAFARGVLCNPRSWNQLIKEFLLGKEDGDSVTASCQNASSGYCDNDGICEYPLGAEGDLKRRQVDLFGRQANRFPHSHHHHHHSRHSIEARGVIVVVVRNPDTSEDPNRYQANRPDHPQIPAIQAQVPRNPLLDEVVVIDMRPICYHTRISLMQLNGNPEHTLQVEHTVDFNIIQTFFETSTMGRLASDAASRYGPMPLVLWDELWDINLMLEPGVPSLPGGSTVEMGWIMNRVMECLGSKENDQVFMLVEADINAAKNYIMRFQRRISTKTMKGHLLRAGKSKKKILDEHLLIVGRFRACFAMFQYMKQPEFLERFNKIIKDVYLQLKFAEKVFNRNSPENVRLADYWLEWITDYYAHVVKTFKSNIVDMIADARELARDYNDSNASMLRYNLLQFERRLGTAGFVTIDTSGFPSPVRGDGE